MKSGLEILKQGTIRIPEEPETTGRVLSGMVVSRPNTTQQKPAVARGAERRYGRFAKALRAGRERLRKSERQRYRGVGYPTPESRAANCLLGPFERCDHASIKEIHLIFPLLKNTESGVMIDVGAHRGTSLLPFARDGWRIHAFEPDTQNRSNLARAVSAFPNVTVDERAVSDASARSVPFYSSEESTGISCLRPFTDSHVFAGTVDAVTLTDFCSEQRISRIDFLKIDVEGYDLMVLKGLPWDSTKPNVIMCEFEDRRSKALGYTMQDMACYLAGHGYTVLVSEWHPVTRYGGKQDWHRLVLYPCELAAPNAWGNLIAFRDRPDLAEVAAIARGMVELAGQQAEDMTTTPGLSQPTVVGRPRVEARDTRSNEASGKAKPATAAGSMVELAGQRAEDRTPKQAMSPGSSQPTVAGRPQAKPANTRSNEASGRAKTATTPSCRSSGGLVGYLKRHYPTIITVARFGLWSLGIFKRTFLGIGGVALLVVAGLCVAAALVEPLRWYLVAAALLLLLLGVGLLGLSYVHSVLSRLAANQRRELAIATKRIDGDVSNLRSRELEAVNKATRWNTLKGRYKGQRAFLIGNGPSLNKTPLHLLKNEFTMCFNRFDLMFERLGWRPTMYMCVDDRVAGDIAGPINEIVPRVCYAFFPDVHPRGLDFRSFIEEAHNVFWLSLKDERSGCFRDDLPTCMKGGTVAFSALQVLAFMGFSPIYLVGVDMDYEDHATAVKHSRVDWTATRDDDPNHFDPRYFGAGAKYHRPHLGSMLPFLQRAKEHLDEKGTEVLNAGIGGALEIFPRVDFRTLFDPDEDVELEMLLDAIHPDLRQDAFHALNGRGVVAEEDAWDETSPVQVTTLELAGQLIPKVIFTHVPYGPFDNRYLFIRRDSIPDTTATIGAAGEAVSWGSDGSRTQVLSELQGTVGDVKEEMAGAAEDRESLREAVARVSVRLAGLTEDLNRLDRKTEQSLSASEATLAELKNEIREIGESIKNSISAAEARHEALNKEVSEGRDTTDGLKKMVSASEATLTELKQEISLSRDATDGLKKMVSASEATLAELKNEVSDSNAELAKMNVGNASLFQQFNRRLRTEDLKRFAAEWGPKLGLNLDGRALGYVAHRICLAEDTCIGRLGGNIDTMVLRVMVARSIKEPDLEVLEIGTLFGIGAAMIHENCLAFLDRVHVTVIDPLSGYYGSDQLDILTRMPVTRDIFVHNMQRMHIPESDYTIIQELSTDDEAIAQASKRRYNLLIIDGDHSDSGVKHDFFKYRHLVKPGGYIFFDDYGNPNWPGLTDFVNNEVSKMPELEFLGTDVFSAVFRVTAPPDSTGHGSSQQE